MKKYTTPDIMLTVITSSDIITGSLTVGVQSIFGYTQSLNDLDFSNTDIVGF